MALTSVLFLSLLCAASTFVLDEPHSGRNVVTILRVNNGAPWGIWGAEEFCPPNSYATGYSMKLEGPKGNSDDSSLNAIRLICTNKDAMATEAARIHSLEGLWGDWTQDVRCQSQQYLTGYQMQVEGNQNDGDDTAANFVSFLCRPFGAGNEIPLSPAPHHGNYGTWGSTVKCPVNSAICGMKTRVEAPQGFSDDTALNDATFFCCSF